MSTLELEVVGGGAWTVGRRWKLEVVVARTGGVIWKGDKLIEGVPQALQSLRSTGKNMVFVINNSTKSRRQYAKKFIALGIDASEDEIFSSSFAVAIFLKLNNFSHGKKDLVSEEVEVDHAQVADIATELAGSSLVDCRAERRGKLRKVSNQGPGRIVKVETRVIHVDDRSPLLEEGVDLQRVGIEALGGGDLSVEKRF
ncbi:uncharacterized protein A4U43_C08F19300 [Asparagus officinalis]|nr:uncharacterized protein A4U43_C08F19300 [Asparagus officinalis]